MTIFAEIEELLKTKSKQITVFYFSLPSNKISIIKNNGIKFNKKSAFNQIQPNIKLRKSYIEAWKDIEKQIPAAIFEVRVNTQEFKLAGIECKNKDILLKKDLQIKFIKGAYNSKNKLVELSKLKPDEEYISLEKLKK